VANIVCNIQVNIAPLSGKKEARIEEKLLRRVVAKALKPRMRSIEPLGGIGLIAPNPLGD
jgi:hypothetical protein